MDDILLKVGVNYDPDVKLLTALRITHEIYKKHNTLLVITSLKDRAHSTGSLHYCGMAFDTRIRHIVDPLVVDRIVNDMRTLLEPDYIVIPEANHIHVQVNLNEKTQTSRPSRKIIRKDSDENSQVQSTDPQSDARRIQALRDPYDPRN